MIREIRKSQISEDKLMTSADTAAIGCSSCEGCGECCHNRGNSITLDSWDVKLLKMGFEMSFQKLIDAGYIHLTLINDIVLPVLGSKEGVEECVFLGIDGRCMIHKIRPGICRMFPLARIYHKDGSFSYFIQEGECPYSDGSQVNISEWLGFKNTEKYENEVREYHDRLVKLRNEIKNSADDEEAAMLNRRFLVENFNR